ncbi:nucleotidyltransferase domain-containing protein [Pseudooceanicola sp.]|uniref:nucleotidyltransferase family protein n=1 Tax=Pseudooceanicola sp. TaxID=1914328 RepID=UPI0035116FCD
MPKALILFGSAARGTQTPDSDVDLLAIGSERYASSSKSNGVEIQSYSEEGFFHLAETGDPFGAHIAMEAVAISDPDSLLSAFRESFRLRESYATESGHAFELAKFLLEFGGRFEDQHLVAKRIAWCVRTGECQFFCV